MSWSKELEDFLTDRFNAKELNRWIFRLDRSLRRSIAGSSVVDIAHSLIETANNQGLIDEKFFEALLEVRPVFKDKIREIQRKHSAADSTPPECPSHAALILDRTPQWQFLRKCCTGDDRHLIIFIEGDHEQDIDLFLRRIELYFNKGKCSRTHHILAIPRTQGHSKAITAADWERRICEPVSDTKRPKCTSIDQAIVSAADDEDVLYILKDHGGAITWSDDNDNPWEFFEGLIEFFRDSVPRALKRSPPARSLRFVVPIQHNPYYATAARKNLRETLKTLECVQGLGTILVPKLTLPRDTDFEQVANDILKPFGGLSETEQHKLKALHRTLTDRKKSPRQRFRTLGQALHEFIQDTINARPPHST